MWFICSRTPDAKRAEGRGAYQDGLLYLSALAENGGWPV